MAQSLRDQVTGSIVTVSPMTSSIALGFSDTFWGGGVAADVLWGQNHFLHGREVSKREERE